ncbi:MAG TPA: parallel beta-helix domain-containing protein [Gemmataceae bacterium]|jgi:parallel beta-helix repeat protein|nr:parallel beta-helix domain-containing protein [Gemmataceae bacterium]
MTTPRWPVIASFLILGAIAGCGSKETPPAKTANKAAPTVEIHPGPNVQEELQTALIKAKPGDVIGLSEGIFEFSKELSLAVENVTIRGEGMDKTILSFKKQDTGKHGLLVTRGKFCIENLTVEDTKGDGLKVNDAEDVVFRRVRARWTGDEKETNGAYGIYPVQSKNVLVEDCEAIGASDAGIYVGQSQNVIVRRCRATRNVAGIEIENCIDADVYKNTATDNAGGLLVFDMPGLQQKNGKRVSVHDNLIYANNHANFAPKGNTVANVAPGTGAMIMATDQVDFFRNIIKDNQTFGLSIISFTDPGKPVKDEAYDRYPEGIFIHDNEFTNCGTNPAGALAGPLAALLGTPFPEIIYDGEQNPAKLVNGKVPAGMGVYLKNNGAAKFANLGKNVLKLLDPANGPPHIDRDIKAYEGELPALPPVKLPGVL